MLILAVGIPPVMSARLSVQQKLILGVIFGMVCEASSCLDTITNRYQGTFVIVAAILRAIYCLVPALISYVYMNWYFREASVAVYVTTLPGIWVFLRELFPVLQKLGSRHGTRPTNSRTDPSQATWRTPVKKSSRFESKELDFDLDTYPISKSIVTTTEHDLGERGAHGDHVGGDASSTSSARYDTAVNEIRRDVTFTVERVPMDRH